MSIAKELDALHTVARELRGATDRLRETIDATEAAIVWTGVGLTVWLAEPIVDEWQLGFAKVGGAWRLSARANPERVIALTSAPLPVRVAALCHFPQLIDQLTSEAVEALGKVQAINQSLTL